MEDLSFAQGLDRGFASSLDGTADDHTERAVRPSARTSPPAYRTESLLDGLSAYATVFDCSACRGKV